VQRWIPPSIAALVLIAAPCAANDKAACLEAHASGQELRLASHWVAAAKKFRECSAASCPGPVTIDCTRWYEELRASTPSILVVVTKPDGAETVDVGLRIDGVRVGDRLPATSIELDPGEHIVHVDRAPWSPLEQRVVVREKERDRRVAFHFAPLSTPAPAPAVRSTPFGWIMVGLGGAAAAAGITFGVLGKLREDELAASPCGHDGTCSHHDVDVVRQRYWVAGIAGSVGVVAIGVGLWYLISHAPLPASATSASAGAEAGTPRSD
jgi:hypothetical protein